MTPCTTKACPNQARPAPGALFCQECQERKLADVKRRWYKPARRITLDEVEAEHAKDLARLAGGGKSSKVLYVAPEGPLPPPPTAGVFDGAPNVTCPACSGRYHYGAPAPFTHLCPLCEMWLCWEETDELRTFTQRVAKACPTCGKLLQEKSGKYGPWWGCTYLRKGHKDNCPGRRKWHDCDTVTETRPRMGLAVWEPPGWSVEQEFSEAVDEARRRYDGIEARGERYRQGRWWEDVE